MRNFSIDEALIKNTRVIVQKLSRYIIEVETIPNDSNENSAQLFPLPQINFKFQSSYCFWTIQRRQFPLWLVYTTIFNSCQGLTLDKVILDTQIPVFTHGQLYNALSRVRTRDDLHFFTNVSVDSDKDNSHMDKLWNMVFKELLL